MENKCCEEGKGSCCEKTENCCAGKENCCHKGGCCGMRKCHVLKKFIMLILMIVIFCLGVQWGEMRSESRGYRYERGGMMNWNYGQFDGIQKGVGSVTVDVSKPAVAPAVTQ